jgi:hypothetical protein
LERHGAEAVVRVRDSGMGISPDLLPRIFDFYVRGEPPACRWPYPAALCASIRPPCNDTRLRTTESPMPP